MAAAAVADCGKRVRRGERSVYEHIPAGEQHRLSGAAPAVGGRVPVLFGAEEAGEGHGLQERGCVRVRVRGEESTKARIELKEGSLDLDRILSISPAIKYDADD